MRPSVRLEEAVLAVACIAVGLFGGLDQSFALEAGSLAMRMAAWLVAAWLVTMWTLVAIRDHAWGTMHELGRFDRERVPVLNVCALPIEVFDFERVDEFAIGSPYATCFVYEHPRQPETVCIYNLGGPDHRIEWEITTRFTNGYTLTTYVGSSRFREPSQVGHFVQVFGGEPPFKTILGAHLEARRMLAAKGLVPMRLETSVRQDVLTRHRERVAYQRTIRFGSLRRLFWLRNCPNGGLLEHQQLPLAELFPMDPASWYADLHPLVVSRAMRPRAVSASELN
jgi:hypothetical protein